MNQEQTSYVLMALGIVMAFAVFVAITSEWVHRWWMVCKWKRMGFTPELIESLKAQHFS